ncbi:tandem-95 repeat protein [Paenibacillus chitinolyticus]|uniref:tandem-95 repeat protein n=1 Tax=Paenibacillus chitinolyticus TaxID=79263 RepID=UPI001C44A8FB|nr:Ig-like domain-containing protein [Paenibacillus chitinolyticus]MBV6715023.1 tandem-95 repeat protein [Paenibacillus chitinolyticus]
MPFINRYSTTTNGAITFTGNTLGLSKQNNANAPETARSIGTFTTVNTSLQDDTYPLGTTSDHRLNSSSAILVLPSQSTVLYAELIWGGSCNLGEENVSSALNNTVSLTNSAGVFTVTPDTAAPSVNTSHYFYVRSANVTSLVRAGGGGTYTVGKVPGTLGDSENSINHAGWTLAVIYQNATLPSRNMTIFVGNERMDTPSSTNSAVVSGFFTPTSGPLSGRLFVSAQEGGSPLTGDRVQFGPTAADLAPVYGPNNPVSTISCSQINNDSGLLDTTGTFVDRNYPTGSVISGGRQGWDVTNVDVSSKLIHSQTSANIRGTTYGDVYLINALALQVNINAPVISVTKESNKTTAYINEAITYKVTISNSGNATANTLTLTDQQPAGTTFIAGSVIVNGTAQASANPYTGISLGNLANSQSIVVQFQSRVTSRPASPAQFADQATVTYQFQSVTGGTVFNGTAASSVVTVAAGNYPPIASDVTGTITEDTSFTGQIPASDPESAVLSYSVASPPAHGTAALNANGSFTYVPNLNFNGTDSFSVTVSDGSGGTANSLVTIRVTPVNDPPAAQNVSFTTLEDTSLSGKVTATEVDGDTLTFSLAVPPAHGTVVFGPTGVFTYTPSPNYNGTDGFTYSVSDGNGGTATASVTITVTPVNDPPVTSNVNLTTAEDTPVTGAVPPTDVDGDGLTYTLASPVTNGSVTLNADGTYVYAPGLHFNGTDSFAVRVSDGKGGTAVSNVTITVTPVNDPPVASGGSVVTPEDTPVSGKINASDADGDALGYALGTAPLNGTVVLAADGSYTYTPLANFNGTDSFTVTVSDGNGGAAISHIVVTVTPVNDLPAEQDKNVVSPEDTPVSGRVFASDVDGDALTFAPGAPPANGTVVVASDGGYTYTPAPDYNGTDSFTVTVSDGNGGTDSAAATVTVTPVNDPPVTSDVALTTTEDTPVSGLVAATDADGDSLTYTLRAPASNGTVSLNPDGTFTYVPALNFNGNDSFAVEVSDGRGGTAVSKVILTVTPVNDPPVVFDEQCFTTEDTPVTCQIIASDVDGDAPTYALGTPPVSGTAVVTADGTYTYTPNPDFYGGDSFTVTVSDGNGGTATETATVNVAPVNDAPVTADLVLTTPEDTAASGQIAATDADGDALTFTLRTQPTRGSVILNPDGTFKYTPIPDFNGTDSFTVLVDDGNGGTAVANVTVTVTPVNDPPVAADVADVTPEDTPVSGQIPATDVDGDALTFALGTPPVNGTAVVTVGGGYTYTPNPDFNGTDSFTVTVSDGNGGTATLTVTVTVTPVNDAPVTADLALTTPEDTPLAGAVTATDADGDALTYLLGTFPTHGTAAVAADGTFTYTPNADFNGIDSFTVTVHDGAGRTDSAVVTVTVVPVNDAPILGSVNEATVEDTVLNGQITAADPEGDPVTYALAAQAANGTAAVNADGSYTYTPNLNFNGLDFFVVTASDGQGGVASAVVNITVTPVNDPPFAALLALSTPENTPVSGRISAYDREGDPIVYTVNTEPGNGTVILNVDGSFIYTPAQGFNGTDGFAIRVSDDRGAGFVSDVTVTVLPVNDPPRVRNVSQSTFVNQTVSGTIDADDIDNDALTYSLDTPPANGTATAGPGNTYTYVPNPTFTGTDSFQVRVTDESGASATAAITVEVSPVFTGSSIETTLMTLQNTPLTSIVPLVPEVSAVYRLSTPPSNGSVSVNADGSFTYVPNQNFTGSDSFVLTESGTLQTVLVKVVVLPANQAPLVGNVQSSTTRNAPVSGTITATDPEGQSLFYNLNTLPLNGTASVRTDGTFTYTPSRNFAGTDSFTVGVTDAGGAVSIALIVITVERKDDGVGNGEPVPDTLTARSETL